MRLPILEGVIRRRVLVNYRVDPHLLERLLPSPFRPKLQNGAAVAGICLIRLEEIHPAFVPLRVGFASENAAHRIAVVWRDEGGPHEGVFIPRRDTGSFLNHLAGGRLFPGEHHRATFAVATAGDSIDLHMQSRDGGVTVRVKGRVAGALPSQSVFASIAEASKFFEPGALGYSVTREPHKLHGIRLETQGWHVEPLHVDEVASSYFDDAARFPTGTALFDSALIMRDIRHRWHAADDLYALPTCKGALLGSWQRRSDS